MRFMIESRDDSFSRQLSEDLKAKCLAIGLTYSAADPELVICIGGDGTILRSIHKYLDQLDRVMFVGIHTGTLGFLTDYTKDHIDDFIYDLQHGDLKCEESLLLEIEVPQIKEIFYAFNEVRLEGFTRTISLDIYINNEFFERTTGSGICISTQAGSTAINRALQGAVVDDGLSVFQLTEIMPISHQNHRSLRNPYIMNSNKCITILGDDLSHANICYDHLNRGLKGVSKVIVKSARKKVRFARYRTYSYFTRLKTLY